MVRNITCCLMLLYCYAAAGNEAVFDRDTALQFSRDAIGDIVNDFELINSDDTPVNLIDYRGKPLVISLIYTSCHHICPTTTQHLRKIVNKARATLGTNQFNVLTIGFDALRDTPQMMQFFADQQRIPEANWYFLSAPQETIDRLAAAVGFLYYPTPNGFDHLIQATILDADGRVYRQVYGINFDTPLLVEPLKELILGERSEDSFLTSLSNQIKLFCTVYDPTQDRYRFDYSIFIGTLIGFLCVGLLGFQLVKEWRLSMRRNL